MGNKKNIIRIHSKYINPYYKPLDKTKLCIIGSFNHWGSHNNGLVQADMVIPLIKSKKVEGYQFEITLPAGLSSFKPIQVIEEVIMNEYLKILTSSWIPCYSPFAECIIDDKPFKIFCDAEHNNNWVIPFIPPE